MSKEALEKLQTAQTIAIKIGTSQIFNAKSRSFNTEWLSKLAQTVAKLIEQNKNIVLIPSAMVAAGLEDSGVPKDKDFKDITNEEKRYAATFGTAKWHNAFQDAFKKHNICVASTLITGKSLRENKAYRHNERTNIQKSFENRHHLLIVNENDPVEDEQLKRGDNDTLGADVAILSAADLYLILTDIDGLYDRSPSKPGAQFIENLDKITEETMAMANGAKTALSTGGMETKLEAARQFSTHGKDTIIANGVYISRLFNDSSVPSTLITTKNTATNDNAQNATNELALHAK